ncbi:MAG: DNA-processing protein DprA [Candidatus Hydrogenedentota bacterium]|nr:MAG: DNA-processing protein DprA [Candidatus Hydrogenedentota bacterium]
MSEQELFLSLHFCGATLQEPLVSYLEQENYSRLLLYAKNLYGTLFLKNLEKAKRTIELCHKKNCFMITIKDKNYPKLLSHIPQAPLVFFARHPTKKQFSFESQKTVSIIGTRKPSATGILLTRAVASFFAKNGFTVVSGMAMGIDAIAHRSALKYSESIGVIAHGLDYIYPQVNRDLYMEKNLWLLTEYTFGQTPKRYHFPRRNRIISGLSPITIFMEGGTTSGGQITVRYALQQGREVCAFSHSLLLNNKGGEKLISEGAFNLSPFFRVEQKEGKGINPFVHNKEYTSYLGNFQFVRVEEPSGNLAKELLSSLLTISENCFNAFPLFKVNRA